MTSDTPTPAAFPAQMDLSEGEPKGLFLIWSKLGKKPPRVWHTTFEDAAKEAQRLASVKPGQRFFVMRADSSFKIDEGEMTAKAYLDPTLAMNREQYEGAVG